MTSFTHDPVMLEEVFEYLKPALEVKTSRSANTKPEDNSKNEGRNKTYYDLTLGLGGHTSYFLEQLPNIYAIGIDRDEKALAIASARLQDYTNRFKAVHATYDKVGEIAREMGKRPCAILMDLGVSSMQLDDAERGFAYTKDAALDMRMDQSQKLGSSGDLTVAELIQEYSVEDLAQNIRDYGEEKHSKLIAKSIKDASPKTTGELADAIRAGLPASLRRDKYAMGAIKRVFQALRISVNHELEILQSALDNAISALEVGGRIAVLTYHSLEDRIVKQTFSRATDQYAQSLVPKYLPVLPDNTPKGYLKLLTRGAQIPTASDIESNSRAKSAKLRVAVKTRELNGAGSEIPYQARNDNGSVLNDNGKALNDSGGVNNGSK
ncbi:ribosomal RNA small subunit methyltransferase H [Actinomycetota bacterium]|nr:ribosomal RNA small subunit methyltransferase H [Actinomycetota bacterium]